MKGIRAILIDDEPRGLTSLQKLLELNCPEVNVLQCCSGADEAKNAIADLHPDLVFLDIAMPGKNGFELLQELPAIDFEIIFVTAHDNFTSQALHLSAVDYLLKPVDDDLLVEAVKRAARKIGDKSGKQQIDTFLHNMVQSGTAQKMKLCIPSMKGFQVVDIRDISTVRPAAITIIFILPIGHSSALQNQYMNMRRYWRMQDLYASINPMLSTWSTSPSICAEREGVSCSLEDRRLRYHVERRRCLCSG
jgi:two-component SAPR family response regulator